MNKFELKGKVQSIQVVREGKVAVMHLEIESNGYINVIPVTVFNKLSDVKCERCDGELLVLVHQNNQDHSYILGCGFCGHKNEIKRGRA